MTGSLTWIVGTGHEVTHRILYASFLPLGLAELLCPALARSPGILYSDKEPSLGNQQEHHSVPELSAPDDNRHADGMPM